MAKQVTHYLCVACIYLVQATSKSSSKLFLVEEEKELSCYSGKVVG